jgi:hypothetical protein
VESLRAALVLARDELQQMDAVLKVRACVTACVVALYATMMCVRAQERDRERDLLIVLEAQVRTHIDARIHDDVCARV